MQKIAGGTGVLTSSSTNQRPFLAPPIFFKKILVVLWVMVRVVMRFDLTVAFTSAKMAEMCGNRQSDLPSIATYPKQLPWWKTLGRQSLTLPIQ
jgi:hypothetical protein